MQKVVQIFDPRQTMHRADFEVFHYHDAKMQDVPLHHHDFYEVYYFLSGKVEYQVEGRSFTLAPEDILLISPRDLHRPNVAPDQPYERIVLWIDAGYFRQIAAEETQLPACFEAGRNLLHAGRSRAAALMRRMAEEAVSDEAGSALYTRGLFFQFLAELQRLFAKQKPSAESPETPPLIVHVLQYLCEHFREELSLDAVARQFFVSKYYLSHLFRNSVGTSLYRYILLKRLQTARQMLAEGAVPGDACRESGFQDYTSFYRAFRQVYGISPQEAARRV